MSQSCDFYQTFAVLLITISILQTYFRLFKCPICIIFCKSLKSFQCLFSFPLQSKILCTCTYMDEVMIIWVPSCFKQWSPTSSECLRPLLQVGCSVGDLTSLTRVRPSSIVLSDAWSGEAMGWLQMVCIISDIVVDKLHVAGSGPHCIDLIIRWRPQWVFRETYVTVEMELRTLLLTSFIRGKTALF